MKKDNWLVENEGIRPAGSANNCFYCNAEKGCQHKEDCVIRQRTIVLKMEIEIVVSEPEYWDIGQIEFHKNDGTWCSGNIFKALDRLKDINEGCVCDISSFKYVREATEKDEDRHKIFVKDFKS